MKRSKLKNKANKTKHPLDIMNYKKQRNYVTKLSKTEKLECFNNLKLGKDNKPFWEKCKPYFINKQSKADTDIMLNQNGELLLKDKDVADILGPLLNQYIYINGKMKLVIWVEMIQIKITWVLL